MPFHKPKQKVGLGATRVTGGVCTVPMPIATDAKSGCTEPQRTREIMPDK